MGTRARARRRSRRVRVVRHGSDGAVEATPVPGRRRPCGRWFALAIAPYDFPSCSRTSRFLSRESVGPPWKADIPPIIIHIIATIIRMQNRATTEITSLPWHRS